jgi:O-antigen ligase
VTATRDGWPHQAPSWIDSIIFVAMMSGPPKFRDRDYTASLTGEIDWVVAVHIVVWGCGALWTLGHLFPYLRRGLVPALNSVQLSGALLIVGLTLSLWHSPGFMLTAFVLGQFTIMLCFAWLFVQRFGPSSFLHHLFAGVCLLTVGLIVTAILDPDLVITLSQGRFRGERIATTGAGAVALMGLVFCLSNVPRLRSASFWGFVALFGVLLATSRMRTAYVAMIAYLAFGYVFGRGLPVRRLVPLLLVVSLGLIVLDASTQTVDYMVRDTKSIETMSDRIPLWHFLTAAVMRDEPLFGFGYYAASRVIAPQYNPRLGTAHSTFFEFLVGGGIVGATLYLFLCASLVWYAARLMAKAGGQPENVTAVGLLIVALVLGLSSSEAAQAGPVGFSFWSMTALLPALYRQATARKVPHYGRLQVRPMVVPPRLPARRIPLSRSRSGWA